MTEDEKFIYHAPKSIHERFGFGQRFFRYHVYLLIGLILIFTTLTVLGVIKPFFNGSYVDTQYERIVAGIIGGALSILLLVAKWRFQNSINQAIYPNFDLIKRLIRFREYKAEEISNKTVGWQLDHALRVILGISKNLQEKKERPYKAKWGIVKSYIFYSSSIPRGKGRAPKQVVSQEEEFSKEDLESLVAKAEKEFLKLNKVPNSHYFKHPLFGDLKKKKAMVFIGIHTQHHLKIVRDIVLNNPRKQN